MQKKIKVAFLVVLMLISSVLLMLPNKAEAGVIVIIKGKPDIIDGLAVCVCPTKDHTCECEFHFPMPY